MSLRDQLLEIINMGKRRLDETDAQTLARMRSRLISVVEAEWREVDAHKSVRDQIADAVQDISVGRCVVVGYHKIYAVSASGAKEISDYIIALLDDNAKAAPNDQ